MNLQQVIEKFTKYPKYMECGAGKLSRRFRCSKEDIYKARRIVREEKNRVIRGNIKILVFDIETTPTISYTWRRFQENIGLDQVIHDPIMLTWSAMWLDSDDVMSDRLTPEEVLSFNDYRIVKSLWELINEADVVVAHYGDKFDIPMLNARAIINDIPPFSFAESIDTKRIASKHFKFPSNKLDALATYFGFENKIKTDFMLWRRCMEGDDDAIEEMSIYCDQDVRILKKVYLKLRPYIKSHPNVGLYVDTNKPVCSHCGSSNLTEDGSYYTRASKFKVFRCECGALSRVRQSSFKGLKSKDLLVSNAK